MLNGKEYSGNPNFSYNKLCKAEINTAIMGIVIISKAYERLEGTTKNPHKAIAVRIKLNPI